MTVDDTFWEQITEPCGAIFELEGVYVIGDGNYRRKVPDVQLVCTLAFGHTPRYPESRLDVHELPLQDPDVIAHEQRRLGENNGM